MKNRLKLFLFVLFVAVGINLYSQETPLASDQGEPIQIELMVENETIQAGSPFWVAIKMSIAPNWHTYWKNPGETGAPLSIQWELPPHLELISIDWPFPKRFDSNSTIGFGYEGEVYFLAKLQLKEGSNETLPLQANLKWIVCSDSQCVPGGKSASTQLFLNAQTPNPNSLHQSTFQVARSKLPIEIANIEAERKNNSLNLTFPQEAIGNYQEFQTYFCPDMGMPIDLRANPSVTSNRENASVTLSLKELEEGSSESVKGILVVNADEPLAYLIDAPIRNTLAIDKQLETPNQSPTFEGGFGLALVFAFIGGMILNLMPCVLPVISLKILSFVKMAGSNRKLILKHGIYYSIGVLLSFWTLAGLLLVFRAYGETVGWGFQLQEPIFVAILASLVFLLSLSLFGVFEMGITMTSWAGQAGQTAKSKGAISSLFSGILATAVATPCTGPFLGSAVGFAATVSAPLALLIFTSLGLGMAFPYLLLSAFPAMLKFLPKPGQWMIVFKELMGFMMLATVIWLVWVFSAQTSSLAVLLLLVSFFLMAIASWIYGTWGTPIKTRLVRRIGMMVALIVLGMGFYPLITAVSLPAETVSSATAAVDSGEWEAFSPERVEELRKKGIPVLIDFTAKWCLICQANHLVLSSSKVDQKLSEKGVVKMKADWTKNDPVITQELKKFGRNSVPLYILYGTDQKEPEILPQILTPDVVINAVDQKVQRDTVNAN